MKLRRLGLENFRQFYGRQEIVLGDSPAKNVCLIYAANGAGKTTLLNAFTWALYNKLSSDFEQPENLVNNRAWDELGDSSSITARVSVEFEHDGRVYTMTRGHEARKQGGEQVVLRDGFVSLSYVDENGENQVVGNPSNAMNQILPERLHTFFFFNGERIEHLVKPSAYEEIEEAVKTLLGLEVVSRGQHHLSEAIKKLQSELRSLGSGESQEIIDEIERLTDERRDFERKLAELKEELNAFLREREAIYERLRNMADTRQLQERRDQLQERMRDAAKHGTELSERLAEVLGDRGYVGLLAGLTKQVLAIITENRVRGELPAPIKKQFVQDLLEQGSCICGTKLIPGEEPHAHVADWIRRSGLADIEDAITRTGAYAEDFSAERSELDSEIARTSRQLTESRSSQQGFAEQLEEVSGKLKDLPLEEITALESRREAIEADLEQTRYRLASVRAEIDAKANAEKAKEKQLERVKEKNQKAALALERVSVATEARELLANLHELRTQDVRRDLDCLVRDVYRRISFKDYRPELTEAFRLELLDPHRGNAPVPRSTGENQILSLSFVGALAAIAKKGMSTNGNDSGLSGLLGFEGGVYPIVMDAAFGALDENYRRSVAQALPKLTDQVVVLVSKSQGTGPVEEELQARVGDEYVILYHTPRDDAEDETISLHGRDYPYISRSRDGLEWASLERVR